MSAAVRALQAVARSGRVASRVAGGGGGGGTDGDDPGVVGRVVTLVGVALLAVGSVLDWHVLAGNVVAGIQVEQAISGLSARADGDITLAVAVVGGGVGLVFWDRGGWAVAALTAVVAGGFAVFHLLAPGRALGLPRIRALDYATLFDPGLGLYLLLLGAGVTLVGALVGFARS